MASREVVLRKYFFIKLLIGLILENLSNESVTANYRAELAFTPQARQVWICDILI